jgi:branched-chain amino acid transport system permease protein
MEFSFDLLFEAVVFGVLLGCFYAAVSIGLSVRSGLLDVPHVAHPALIVLGSYCTFLVSRYGIDPIVAGVLLMPLFFLLGVAIYRFYYETFEKRGTEAGVRGIAFFFGVALIIEVGLILVFGVDQRTVEAPYIGKALDLGEMRIPLRFLVAFGVAVTLMAGLTLYLSKTFTGRAIKAVAQDEPALRLMGANPVRIKQWAFGIATGNRGAGRGAVDCHRPGRPRPRPRLHRAHVQRRRAGRARQHDRNARCRRDPRLSPSRSC